MLDRDDLRHFADVLRTMADRLDKQADEGRPDLARFRLPEAQSGRLYGLPESVIAAGGLHPNPSECCNAETPYGPGGMEWDYCTLPPGHDGPHRWPWLIASSKGEI